MVDVPGPRTLVVLTRAPSAGGKTRLFGELRRASDPALLSALLLDTLDGARGDGAAVQEGATVRDVACVVAVTPGDGLNEVAALVGDKAAVFPQVDGDLGARMAHAMSAAFAAGASMVALIGSDIPHITGAHVERAFAHLARDPASIVLGPATDGGYYLVGATSVPPVFDGIEWGGGSVLAATVGRAAERGVRVHLLDPLSDVDSVDTLRQAARTGRAPRSAAWLAKLSGN